MSHLGVVTRLDTGTLHRAAECVKVHHFYAMKSWIAPVFAEAWETGRPRAERARPTPDYSGFATTAPLSRISRSKSALTAAALA